jgi:hypothetical protein
MTLWLFKQRLSLSAQYCPKWDAAHYALWTNGGRYEGEVLDVNMSLWHFAFSLTLWRIGGFERVLKHVPTRHRDRNPRDHSRRIRKPAETA